MNLFNKANVFLVLLAAILLMAPGCSDDDDPVRVEKDPIIEPDTPNELMARFLWAYENRDAEQYQDLLAPEFQFLLQSETTSRIPGLGTSLDFADEERIHQRMFSGKAVTDPEGEIRPAVVDIVFLRFQALDVWSNSDDEVLFPDSVWAIFEVELDFDCGPNNSTLKVIGVVKAYARAYPTVVGDSETTYYRMAGMVDLTELDKGIERTPWGLIKAFYR